MGKVLVFIFEGMTDYEITFISHLLSADAGKEIITIAYEDKVIKGKSGILYKPTKTVKEVLDEEVEGLIITGGWYGEDREELITLINNIYNKGKLVSGICGAGTVFLAKAGVLKNVKYTTPIDEWTSNHEKVFGGEDPFQRENFIHKRVYRDKNVITAQGIAFIDFAVEICDWFGLFKDNNEKNEFHKNIAGQI